MSAAMTNGTAESVDTDNLRFWVPGEHHAENGTLLGFWLYLMSDCLIFAVLFAVYAVLGRSYAAGPSGADLFDLPLVAINTSMLLFSSITYAFAMLEMQKNRLRPMLVWLGITVLLGCLFLFFQVEEYLHAYQELNLTLGSGIYGSTFFMLTGFHGAHVFLGTLMLAIMWLRVAKGHFTRDNHFAFEAAAWYWHFVDVVWLGLFLFVYVL